MVNAWFMDNSDADQRLPHHLDPPQFVDVAYLRKCGVLYFGQELDRIRAERGYNYEDELECCQAKLPDYENKLKNFFTEHLHSDEEIRYFIDGGGYFDIRDFQDRWVRIQAEPGDLLIVPAGIYHRFTLDTNNYARVKRLFCGEPVWTPINRPADQHPARNRYLNGIRGDA